MTPELARYLEEAPAFHPLLPQALALDKVYIPTRYPDAHPAGPAARHYTRLEAEEALDLAQKILAFVEEKL